MTKVEKQISDQREGIAALVKEVEKRAKVAFALDNLNSLLVSYNSEKIQSQEFQLQQLTKSNKVKEELDDCRNRSMNATIIFIKQLSSRESWEELKLLLANEIKKITPENTLEYITSKNERTHPSQL